MNTYDAFKSFLQAVFSDIIQATFFAAMIILSSDADPTTIQYGNRYLVRKTPYIFSFLFYATLLWTTMKLCRKVFLVYVRPTLLYLLQAPVPPAALPSTNNAQQGTQQQQAAPSSPTAAVIPPSPPSVARLPPARAQVGYCTTCRSQDGHNDDECPAAYPANAPQDNQRPSDASTLVVGPVTNDMIDVTPLGTHSTFQSAVKANAIPNFQEATTGLKPGSRRSSSGDHMAVPRDVNLFKGFVEDRLTERQDPNGCVSRSDIFASIHETTMHDIKPARCGSTQPDDARIGSKFNSIHCGLYQTIETYRDDLGPHYYPALDLHLTVKRKRDEHATRYNKRRRIS